MQSIRRDCYMMGMDKEILSIPEMEIRGLLSNLISIGYICVLCCMAVFSCAISWPSFRCKQPIFFCNTPSLITFLAKPHRSRSAATQARLFVHANCDPSSLPLHEDRRASGPESRHGEAVKSDLPARPSKCRGEERKEPTTYFGVVPLFLFSQLDAARPNSSAWRRESSVRYCSLGELSLSLLFSLSSAGR